MKDFINWVANWPAWVGVPIGIVFALTAFLIAKKRWNL